MTQRWLNRELKKLEEEQRRNLKWLQDRADEEMHERHPWLSEFFKKRRRALRKSVTSVTIVPKEKRGPGKPRKTAEEKKETKERAARRRELTGIGRNSARVAPDLIRLITIEEMDILVTAIREFLGLKEREHDGVDSHGVPLHTPPQCMFPDDEEDSSDGLNMIPRYKLNDGDFRRMRQSRRNRRLQRNPIAGNRT